MASFVRNNVYKIACWNIFSELRFRLSQVEDYVNTNKQLIATRFELEKRIHEKEADEKIASRRLSHYVEPDLTVTFDRFVGDLEKYLPELLPYGANRKDCSLVIAKNLYNNCKHERMEIEMYSPSRREEFADEMIKEVQDKCKTLKNLHMGIDNLLKDLG